MNKLFCKNAFGWGFLLWLFGYILGILLFAFVPVEMLGWFISPPSIIFTLWVLFRRIEIKEFNYYIVLSIIWTIMAIILDYFFIVKAFNPPDGYYKFDIYMYYALTFLLPLFAGWKKSRK